MEETELDDMQRESLRMIIESGGLLRMVVDDVLDYSKLEYGHFELDPQMSDLQDILDGVVPSMVAKANERNIRLQTIYGAAVGSTLRTDRRRLQQVCALERASSSARILLSNSSIFCNRENRSYTTYLAVSTFGCASSVLLHIMIQLTHIT